MLKQKILVVDLDGCEGILGVDVLNQHSGVLHLGGGYLDLQGHIMPLDHSSLVSSVCRAPVAVLADYLQSMVDCIEGLTLGQREQVVHLVCEYNDIFADEDGSFGRTSAIQHTGLEQPIKQAPRRMPLAKRKILEAEVDKMLKQGVIEPSNSAWSSPVVLVEKKDGFPRFCVDFRKLNQITVKDAYSLPNAEELIDELSGSQ